MQMIMNMNMKGSALGEFSDFFLPVGSLLFCLETNGVPNFFSGELGVGEFDVGEETFSVGNDLHTPGSSLAHPYCWNV